jgi:hypothetical protein
MKIRKVLDKKVGDVSYEKYLVTLPKKIVEESGLIGKEIKAELRNDKIIIEEI